jgi:hypothetical protein
VGDGPVLGSDCCNGKASGEESVATSCPAVIAGPAPDRTPGVRAPDGVLGVPSQAPPAARPPPATEEMTVPRSRRGPWAALLPVLALTLPSCSGTSDPSSPVVREPVAGTYFHATITLLDTGPTCIPNVSCAPEFFDCDGSEGFLLGRTWSFDADEASAGATSYTAATPTVPNPIGNVLLRGTDTVDDIGLSLAVRLQIDAASRTWAAFVGPDAFQTFVNVEASCAEVNADLDPFTQFSFLPAQPNGVSVGQLPLLPSGDVEFSQVASGQLSGGVIEGTFSFIGQNQQEFGQVFVARVRVDGCFRMPVPRNEQSVELDPSASPGCP